METIAVASPPRTIPATRLNDVIALLSKQGYTVIGPTYRERSIRYEEITSVEQLPRGWGDTQEAATYRIAKQDHERLFDFTVPQSSWKQFLHRPVVRLWQAKRANGDFSIEPETIEARPMAFLGVRACELAAIRIQDKVFLEGPYADPIYRRFRQGLFIIAVQCTRSNATCFCTSMGTGPRATAFFDLALTELHDNSGHRFVVEIGSKRGEDLLTSLGTTESTHGDIALANQGSGSAAGAMTRSIEMTGLPELLAKSNEHPRWHDVAKRCLACGNCTLACPTCFCTTVEDTTDLTGNSAERSRKWDSCFTLEFSYIHGGSVRTTVNARYRQWLTHKLGTWHAQFGSSGCVGCGRCITWCPAGIDITEEARAIRQHGSSHKAHAIG